MEKSGGEQRDDEVEAPGEDQIWKRQEVSMRDGRAKIRAEEMEGSDKKLMRSMSQEENLMRWMSQMDRRIKP